MKIFKVTLTSILLLTSYQIFKKGGLTGPQFLQGGCWERGGDFFQRGEVQFVEKKKKLKSGVFHEKKVYKPDCFAQS